LVRRRDVRCNGESRSPQPRNARVAAGASLSASTVNTPEAIASATHRRPAASKTLRQAGRQNTCRLPPSRRGVNPFPHQRQTGSPGGAVISEASSIGRGRDAMLGPRGAVCCRSRHAQKSLRIRGPGTHGTLPRIYAL
jgi:hypothetical protein